MNEVCQRRLSDCGDSLHPNDFKAESFSEIVEGIMTGDQETLFFRDMMSVPDPPAFRSLSFFV